MLQATALETEKECKEKIAVDVLLYVRSIRFDSASMAKLFQPASVSGAT